MSSTVPAPEEAAPPTGSSGAPGSGGLWVPGRRALTVGLVLTITLVAFEALAIATVMPRVEDDLGDLALYGWVFSGFFLGSLVGIVVTGILVDRRGPALPFAAGLLLFAASLIAASAAPSMTVLVLARVAQGVGAGAIPASAYAAVAHGYPAALRPRVFAVFSTAWVIPAVVGPSAAVLIERIAGWRAVFWAIVPVVVVAGAIALPPLRALGRARRAGEPGAGPPTRAEARTRLVAVAALVPAVAAVLLGATVEPVGLAVVLVGVGAPSAVVALRRIVPPGTLRLAPGLPATVALRGLLTCAFFGIDAFVSLAVTEGPGGSTALAGAVLSVTAVMWTAGSWTQERTIARVGPRRLDRIAFGIIALAGAAMVVTTLALPAPFALLSWGIAGYGMGLGYAPLSVTALACAARGREGEASASLQLCDTLGTAVGTGLGGALLAFGDGRGVDTTVAVALPFVAGIVVAVAGAAATRRLPAALPRSAA